MDAFIARQPIVDRRRQVQAYELLFRSGLTNAFAHENAEEASARVIADGFLLFGIQQLTGGRRAFINFTRDAILNGYPTALPRELVVVEILETVRPEPAVREACRDLKRRGYQLALDDFPLDDLDNPLLDVVDIVKVDLRASGIEGCAQLARALVPRGVTLLAEKVEQREEFDQVVALGFEYFQGYFISRPVIVSATTVPALKLRYLQFLAELNRADIDFDRLEAIFKQEVSLSYKFLRYVNSVAFGFKREISSVKHALVLLGEHVVRQWGSIIVLAGIAVDQPTELAVTSMVRARFCESLAPYVDLESRADDLFMMGLFSLLDAIIGRPLPELLADLPVAADVKRALSGEANRFRNVFDCALAYERGDWTALEACAATLGARHDDLPSRYLEAVEWARSMLPGTDLAAPSG